MSNPAELSFDEILAFMLAHNGKVTNHELVKHFKVFLTNPDMRDEARNTFKKHVNALAIIKNHNNEKWLILKKKYLPTNGLPNKESNVSSCYNNFPDSPTAPQQYNLVDMDNNTNDPIPYRPPPPPFQLNQDLNMANIIALEASKNIPEEPSPILEKENMDIHANIAEEAPKVHPRRKSSTNSERKSNPSSPAIPPKASNSLQDMPPVQEALPSSKSEVMLVDNEQKISVKERKQMFNRMASEGDILRPHPTGNQFNVQGADEEDRASVTSLDRKGDSAPLDSKQKAWILCAARGEYHALAKMCSANSKLAKTKDPFTTAMHWACKRGDENLVKLIAGVSRNIVNERSGYTPLHIAMQFRHENVFQLLVDVYDADPNIRDWSGKKPKQYFVYKDTSFSPGSYRKNDSYDLRRTVTSPPQIRVTPNPGSFSTNSKKEGFLRIGSLNVRVKKTTEAFSNFLGVGATRSSAYVPKTARLEERRDEFDHIHKNWGSADNIPKDDKLMPPPMSNKVRRRGVSGRKGLSSHSQSTPSTPDQARAHMGASEEGDSDSDSAAGFHSAWRQQRASDVM